MTTSRIIALAIIALAGIVLVLTLRAALVPHTDPLNAWMTCYNNQIPNITPENVNPMAVCGPEPLGN
jgi:hypothetical protein